MCGTSYLKGACARYNAFVDDHVIHTSQPITNSISNLHNGVCVWTFDEKRH